MAQENGKQEETPQAAAQFTAGAALKKAVRDYEKFPTVENEEVLVKAARAYRGDFLKAFTTAVK